MPESDGSVQSVPSSLPACSEWARSQHLDPVGSAGYYDGFLLVEQTPALAVRRDYPA